MKKILSTYKSACFELLTHKGYVVPLVLTLVAGYGLLVVHPTVNWDFSGYKEGNTGLEAASFFLKGRCAALFLMPIIGANAPFWNEVLGCCILFWAAVTWSVLWQTTSRKPLKPIALSLFALLFVSYPLNNEIFLFPCAFAGCSCGYLTTGIGLILAHDFFETRRKSVLFWAIACQSFAISVYQSFAGVYLCGMFTVLLLSYRFRAEQPKTAHFFLIRAAGYAGILAGGIVLWLFIAKAPRLVFEMMALPLPQIGGAHDQIAWFASSTGFFSHMGLLFKGMAYHYLYSALFYESLRYFLLAALVAFVLAIVWSVRTRAWMPLFLATGLIGSNFALALIQGAPTPYRACQSFAVMVGVVWMSLYLLAAQRVRLQRIVLVVAVLLVLFQSRDLSLWFYNNYRRFEMDKNNFQTMVNTLESKFGRNIRKPVVVVGEVPAYPTLRNDDHPLAFLPKKYGPSQENGRNRFSSVGVRREFYLFAKHVCGFVCTLPTTEQVVEAQATVRTNQQPAWPLDGYIREYDQYVVLNLGVDESGTAQPNRAMNDTYLSDNEKELFRKLRVSEWETWMHEHMEGIYRALSEGYLPEVN